MPSHLLRFIHEGSVSLFLHTGTLCSEHRSIDQAIFIASSWGIYTMDEYQEELLEYQAFELDQPEPADDATEL